MSSRSANLPMTPSGLIVDRHEVGSHGLIVHAHGGEACGTCPGCGSVSASVHSRYVRSPRDFPAYGRGLIIRLTARRFRCSIPSCDRKTFVERFAPDVIAARGRRTSRLDRLVHCIGVVLGGRPGERMAERLSMPVSADTLLRTLRRRSAPTPTSAKIVGLDDFAWRRGHRYGTIVCDLERRQIIDLLADREIGTVTAWLKDHPTIETVCRDRGGGYREAATKGAPQAVQIADRWHLLENASAAFLDIVRHHMRHLRRAVTTGEIDPKRLSAVEKRQWAGWLKRDEVNEKVRALHQSGTALKAIVRSTGLSRQTVRRIVRGTRDDVFRSRESTLDRWNERLETEWAGGCQNGTELWRRLRSAGFSGSLRVVSEWRTRKRRSVRTSRDQPPPLRMPSARTIARLLTTERACKGDDTIRLMVAIETASPAIVKARNLLDRFAALISAKKHDLLDPWLSDAAESEMASFAEGIAADKAAVTAAVIEPWSNGQTEGQVTKLKLVKRQMYGRAKVDLLRARLMATAGDH
jgi:transposase